MNAICSFFSDPWIIAGAIASAIAGFSGLLLRHK